MAIIVDDISLKLGDKQVMEHFSCQLPDKGAVCLFGPSGCGKTTLLHLLAALHRPQSGAVRGLENKRVALVFQEDRLLPWLTAAQNVALVLKESGGDGIALAQPWLEVVELAEQADKWPHKLSGGMRRRVSIARALAYNGDILLLDEPTNGLDEALARRVIEHIKTLYAARLIVMVTHDKEFADAYADMLIELSGTPLRTLEIR